MLRFTDEELEQMALVEGALEMTAAIDPAFPTGWVRLQINKLAQEAEHALMDEPNPHLRLEGLIRLFYREWGFCGDQQQYFSSENVFLDKVLERKKGIPVSLGAIFLYLAQHLDLPVSSVGFPTQFILKVDWYDGEQQYINPFDGEYLSKRTMGAWLKGHRGPFTELRQEHLDEADNADILTRWLTVMKSALLREEHFADALRCSDMALEFSPGDPHEIRDRGYIYQQLECSHVAAMDYEYFIEQCPEDPAAELLKLQVQALNEEPLTLH
ncbi:SirB1 family protein [Photobacterium alginatilyticum]|uniref:Tetratricopeptide repeat protein n=1 Tax=Photobacterium alginatilyticum TaxID=1775171 RepID=A0ABW9YJA8_9GAMM|nr:tetratricopeptide repeat protein [Photobacterium alginatilyticum]NBI53919.1 tetratricopeptide repeat protein [Photobacterium alginatilyticum]